MELEFELELLLEFELELLLEFELELLLELELEFELELLLEFELELLLEFELELLLEFELELLLEFELEFDALLLDGLLELFDLLLASVFFVGAGFVVGAAGLAAAGTASSEIGSIGVSVRESADIGSMTRPTANPTAPALAA